MTLKSLLEEAVEETKKAVHAAKSVFVRYELSNGKTNLMDIILVILMSH